MKDGAGGVVEIGAGAADGVLPLREVAFLPLRPEPVDLGVVQEEDGIARAGEDVPHVSADACFVGEGNLVVGEWVGMDGKGGY